jgi:hypothetical protein
VWRTSSRGEHDERVKAPCRAQSIERVFQRGRVAEQQRALSEIIDDQRREDQPQPAAPQRRPAEMAHIGVQRLGAGHREKHRAQHQKTAPRRVRQFGDAVERVDRQEDARLLHDPPDPERRQNGEPHQHDRAEQTADRRGALALDHEKPDQQEERDRDHVGLEQRGRDLQPLDSAQHRDCRGNHSVAVKQRGADQAGRHDPEIALAVPAGRAQHQRGQRQQAAFAAVVGAHDDDDVFDRDDQDERPEDQ